MMKKERVGGRGLLVTAFGLFFLVVFLVVVSAFLAWRVSPAQSLRVVFGLVYLLFVPGFLLCWIIFPDYSEIDGIERFGLSLGASIPVVMVVVLVGDQVLGRPLSSGNVIEWVGAVVGVLLFLKVVQFVVARGK